MAGERQVFRTGNALGYAWGILLLAGAAWIVSSYSNRIAIDAMDRLLLTIAALVTLLPLSLHLLLSAFVSAVILDEQRLCIRDSSFSRRCVDLDRISGLKWSYRYGPRIFTRFDQGFATIEIMAIGTTGRERSIDFSYGGRWRHEAMVRLVSELILRTGLRLISGNSPHAPPPDAAEIVLERSMRVEAPPAPEQQVWQRVPGARAGALVLLIAALGFGTWTASATVSALRGGEPVDLAETILIMLPAFVIPAGLAYYYYLQDRFARVVLRDDGIALIDFSRTERFIPWEAVQGLRWTQTHGKHTSGALFLEVADRDGYSRTHHMTGYRGAIPPETIALRGAIIRRLDLVQIDATRPGFFRPQESVTWARRRERGHDGP